MPRLSIDISAHEHHQLKAMAALKGLSIKDYVLSRALVDMPSPETMTDAEALAALKALLSPRLAEADAGDLVTTSADDIKSEGRRPHVV
ncbi:antitoxin [Acuticoccus sp. MNP-M23]|uniref:antitoxin n=1 Tax=Acuticoccus sp. MNP-M23 TaxID=3072793 RepID=UPI0028169C0A|nr:antitoxin [Acuticoccus sp. MNP-M23]WMS41629.1 antitoxin [Acuticoccus sp. MNP-M23]